jgi:hypothetical protein
MRESIARQQLAAAGFIQINLKSRHGVNALMMASKPQITHQV